MDSLVHTVLSNALIATLMAVVVVGLSALCRRPALTHSLWLLVLIKLVTPPLVPVSLPPVSSILPTASVLLPSPANRSFSLAQRVAPRAELISEENAQPQVETEPSEAAAEPPETKTDFAQVAGKGLPLVMASDKPRSPSRSVFAWHWQPPVLAVILSGALGWWILATIRINQFQRLLKNVQPPSREWQAHANELAERMGLGWHPLIWLVPGRVPPMLWAIGGPPRLLVPAELWIHMPAHERTSLLLHELAHLKRRDHWVRWLELIVCGLYWWHPMLWWARRALREAEEQCCDAWVVWAMPKEAHTYASALLAAIEFVSGAPTAPAVASATSGSGHVSCLKRRLQMIVRAKTPKGLSWPGRIAVLAMAALVLPLAPSWGRDDAEQRIAEKLQNDPELSALASQIKTTTEQLRQNSGNRSDLIKSLEQQLSNIANEIDHTRSRLKELAKKGHVALHESQDRLKVDRPLFKIMPEDHVAQMMAEMDKTELELIEAMSMLEVKRGAYDARERSRSQPDAEMLARIKDEFSRDPDVIALKREFEETREHVEHLKRITRQEHDPARVAAQKQFDELRQVYADLWTSKYPEILERLATVDAPSLAAIQELEQKVEALKKKKARLTEIFKVIKVEQKETNDDAFEASFLGHQVQSLQSWEDQLKKNLEQLKFEASREATEKQLASLRDQHDKLRKAKHDQLLALAAQDDDKKPKDDDDAAEKARDAAERFHAELKELLEKLGKELSPVAEEVRKSLEKAVGEVHKSLEKEGLSPDDLSKALDNSYEELRKAFEGGGPVDKELREAIEKARKDVQEAFDRTRGDVDDQVETLRRRSRELRDRAREEYRRDRDQGRRGARREGEGESDRSELDAARRQIRDLEQKLRSATRRLEELEQRESRRNATPRRGRNPEPEARPRPEPAPSAEPAAPATPARPARPNMRRGFPPNRPGPGGLRRAPLIENDTRLRELEEKMDRLLKELENLKGEKSLKESKEPSSDRPRPAKAGSRIIS